MNTPLNSQVRCPIGCCGAEKPLRECPQGGPKGDGKARVTSTKACGPVAYLLRVDEHSAQQSGEVSEWLKEHAWKACSGSHRSRVRIPPSPPNKTRLSAGFFISAGMRTLGFDTRPGGWTTERSDGAPWGQPASSGRSQSLPHRQIKPGYPPGFLSQQG